MMNAIASVKAFARDTCGQALSRFGVTAPGVRLRHRLSIITFHRVLTESQRRLYPLPGLAVTPSELDAHLKWATRHFRCLSLTKALDLWAEDDSSGPPLLAITFDDGQLDNYQNALPVLEKNGVTASFYVPSQILEDPAPLWHDVMATSVAWLTSHLTDPSVFSAPSEREGAGGLLAELLSGLDKVRLQSHSAVETAMEATKLWSPAQRKDWLFRAQALLPNPVRHGWDGFMDVVQMKDLIGRGHEIGSHSHSHPLLPQCSAEELSVEIAGSKRTLESALGAAITTFCYPNGSSDQKSEAHVRKAGYRAAVTTRWGSNPRGQDLYQLQRFDMNAKHAQDSRGHFSAARLAWRMSGWYPGLNSATPDPYDGASSR
jgi:peptidoglycan/xylan/chitin deacetylase (PgdA/CDA1 family)